MDFIKLPPTYYLELNLVRAGEAAEVLWVRALGHVIDQGTDGVVIHEALRRLAPTRPQQRAAALVRYGLWEVHPDGFVFVAWRHLVARESQVSPAVRAFVLERDGHRCKSCGATADLTVDHIHPRLLGGQNDVDNLQTLCRPCNSRKGAGVG